MAVKEIKIEYKDKLKNLSGEYRRQKLLIKNEYRSRIATAEKSEVSQSLPNQAPRRSVLEEIGNSVSHGLGSVFAALAFALMITEADAPLEYAAASVYFFGLFTMFTMSCLYHSFRFGSKVKRVFRRFDYLSIYLLIGATFAPLLLLYVGGDFGMSFFWVQWAIIAAGITLIAVFGPARLRYIHIPLYFVLGWSALVFIPQMIINGDYGLFAWILGGGILYSLGIIPFAVDKKVAHFIWHIFVLLGAVTQWIGIYFFIYLK